MVLQERDRVPDIGAQLLGEDDEPPRLQPRESRSSACLARTSWVIPIAELATMIPRNSASLASPKINVSTPNAARIRLNTVRTFARTMLAYERLLR